MYWGLSTGPPPGERSSKRIFLQISDGIHGTGKNDPGKSFQIFQLFSTGMNRRTASPAAWYSPCVPISSRTWDTLLELYRDAFP